jgi:Ca2+/Na+ antiporter
MTDETGAPPGERRPDGQERKFRIDFIDPLFAVAIHIGFVENLFEHKWFKDRALPNTGESWADVLLFIIGLLVIVLSWVGYHNSINNKPIRDDWRFMLDIVLLVLYIFLLVYSSDVKWMAAWMVLIFVVYAAWDYAKTLEYPEDYYPNRQPRGPRTYISRCWSGWWRCRNSFPSFSEVVTFGWMVFFVVLLPLAHRPESGTTAGRIASAVIFGACACLYRFDKGHRGVVIRSLPMKVFMLFLFAYSLLFYSNALREWSI